MSHFWRHRFQQAHGVQVLTLYPGRIIALYASVGDDVKKGQTLFTIGRLRVVNCSTPAAAIRVDFGLQVWRGFASSNKNLAISQREIDQAASDQETAKAICGRRCQQEAPTPAPFVGATRPLRLRCYSNRDQHEDIPYTSKELRECYRQGAAAFGWDKRNPQPRLMRDGSELVDWDVATGVWEALQMESRRPHRADGQWTRRDRVRFLRHRYRHLHDRGAGTADLLGLPLDNITVKLGDSTLPQAPVEGGSWTAASVSHAIAKTAGELRKELLRVAKTMPGSQPAAAKADGVALIDGKIVDKKDTRRSVSIADAMRHDRLDRIERESTNTFDNGNSHARNTHSAIFAEVRMDEQLGVIRVTRVVNAVAAGRILNSKTAHSQIMGGVVWGIGMAFTRKPKSITLWAGS